MVDLSVIVPTFSVREPLEKCLHSLVHQTLSPSRYEILLVNNGSLGHAQNFLKPLIERYEGRVRLIQAEKNRGYGGGCRVGAEAAAGSLLVFHNDDSIADPTWLALAWSEMQKTPDTGVLTCRIVDAEGPYIQHEGVTMVAPNGLMWQTGYGEIDRPRRQPVCEIPFPEFDQDPTKQRPINLEYFSGCVWATPRHVWDEVGGLGRCYQPGYYEDTEYGLRCRQLGYRVSLLPYVTCSHYGSLTLGHGSPRYWVAFHRSRYLFLLRNHFPASWSEIIRAETRWWIENSAGGNPGACILGFLTLLPGLPGGLLDRSKFGNKMLR